MKIFNFSYLLKREFMNSNNLGNRLFPTGLYFLVIITFTIYLFSHRKTNNIELSFFENHSLYVESYPLETRIDTTLNLKQTFLIPN